MLEALSGQAWHVDEGDLAYYLAEANRVAVARVAQRLGAAASLLPGDVVQRLADADERLESARTRTAASTKGVEDFLSNAYAALEGVFGWVVSLYPDPAVLAALAASASENGPLLQRVAAAVGFTTSDRTLTLLSTTRGVVKGALCHGNKTLPGRLAAGLLAAQRIHDHPLSTLAAREPAALEFLAQFGKLRIDASHDTASVPTVDVASAARDRLFALLRALVGTGPVDVAVGEGADLSWGADLVLRMRAQAERAVQAYTGVDELPDLRTRLIEMHHASVLVRLLAGSGAAPADSLRTRLRDFAVAAAIAMEALLAEVERRAPSLAAVAQTISEDKPQNAKHIAAAAAAVGFDLDTSGGLPECLTHAKPDGYRKAAHGRPQSLQTQLVVQLLSASQQPEHPLREVAPVAPAFLLHVSRVVDARGHGDDVLVTASDAVEIEAMVANDVRVVLAALD